MIKLEDLKPNKGAVKKTVRVGRGRSSGCGKTSSRGNNGEGQRSGRSAKRGFEGGQMPLYRRIPKRGFTCRNSKQIVGINVSALNRFEDGATVTVETMIESGLVSNPKDGVKILGNGEISKKLNVKVNACSESAKAKIEAAGGTVEVI